MSDFGPEVKQLLDRITTVDKNKYIHVLNDIIENPEIAECVTKESIAAFNKLIQLMPTSLCSIDYELVVDTDDGTVNLCLKSNASITYIIYVSGQNKYQCVVWRNGGLTGYAFFDTFWPDTVVKSVMSGNPIYLYASKVNGKPVKLVKHDCFWKK